MKFTGNSELIALKRDKRKALSKADLKVAVEICNRIGVLLAEQEEYEEAAEEHQEELRLAEALGNENDQGIAHRLIGECFCELGRFDEALDHHSRYLELSQSTDNAVETQRAWATLGRTHFKIHCSNTKDEEKSRSAALSNAQMAYFKALQLAEELKGELPPREYAEMKARLLLNLGLIYDQKCLISECADSIRQAFFLCKKFGLQEDLHRCQFCLATVYQNHGQLTSALRVIDEAIVSAKQMKNKKYLCDSLLSKAQMLMSMGDYNGSKIYAAKAHRKCSPTTKHEVTRFLKVAVGVCQLEEKMVMGNHEEQYELLEQVADALASVGCNKQAIIHYQKMLELAKELGKPEEDLAPIYSSLAQTFDDLKDYDKAIEFYEKELDCRQDSPREQCKTLLMMADIQDKQEKDVDIIRQTYEKALHFAVKEGSIVLQRRCLEEQKAFLDAHGMDLEAEFIDSRVDELPFQGSCESEVDGPSPFDNISVSDLSGCSDSDDEGTTKLSRRPQRKKTTTVKKNEKGETPLHRACINGNTKAVKRYLQNGHPVNPRDNCGWLPIHEAANYGHVEIVSLLLENGALKDDRGGELCNGITPMHDAAVGGHFEVLEVLLSSGASVTAVNNSGENPLDCLIEWRKQNEFEMEPEILEHCKKIETIMKEILERQGHQYIRKTRSDRSCYNREGGWISDEEITDASPVATHDIEDVFMDDEEDLHDFDESFVNPLIEDEVGKDWDDPDVARTSYRDAMLGVKKKASNLKDVQKPCDIPALIEEEENIVDDWLIDDFQENKTKRPRKDEEFTSVRKKTKRMKQTKLTRMPLDLEVRKKEEEEEADVIVDAVLQSRNQDCYHEVVFSEVSTPELFCVKVSVKNKDILVPVGDTSLTFAWLAEEAANRYFTLVGMKPTLTLSRKDGAVFTSSDIIGSLLKHSAEILGIVTGWEHLPLMQCYESACNSLKTLRIREFDDGLPAVEESGILSLSNIGIAQQHFLKPLFRAIHFQQTLRCLSMKSVQLNKETAKYLVAAIATLSSLSRLCLDCCSLNATHLQMFSETFAKEFQPTALQELDLSNNYLGEGCSDSLAKFLSFFPALNSIKLAYCDLTSITFKNRHLQSILKEKHQLSHIDISSNKLGTRGVGDLLFCLNSVASLDFSRTQFESGMCVALSDFLLVGGGTLQSLRLSGCCLSNDDMKSLARTLSSCRYLQELDISCNSKVTEVGVIILLRAVDDNDVPLVQLRMEGTFVCKTDTTSIVSERFQKKSLRRISLSVDSEAREVLIGQWISAWGYYASVRKRMPSLLELSVVGD